MNTSLLLSITMSELSVYKVGGHLSGHHKTHRHHRVTIVGTRITMFTYRLSVIVTLMLAMISLVPDSGNAQVDYQWTANRLVHRSSQKYCGRHLSDALQVICDGAYNSFFKKNNRAYASEMEMAEYPVDYAESFPFISRAKASGILNRLIGNRSRREVRKVGIHEECCLKPCSVPELATYCDWMNLTEDEIAHYLSILRYNAR